MNAPQRTTIYLPPQLHRALKLRAAATSRSLTALVQEAIELSLAEDAEDLQAVKLRVREKPVVYSAFIRNLKRRGKAAAAEATPDKYWSSRPVHDAFKRLQRAGRLRTKLDSTRLISEDRDGR